MESVQVGVRDRTHAAEARRTALRFAGALGFNEAETNNVGLVVTEAAKNELKHAGGGEIVLRGWEQGGAGIVEVLAIDNGPGMADVSRSFEDGYSTSGTPGTGLGAISRISTLHDVYSRPGLGTVLVAQIRKRTVSERPAHERDGLRVGAVSVPKPGEPVCGDAWHYSEGPRGSARLIVADGLGHGPLAADAAREAIRVAREHPGEDVVHLMHRIHAVLRPTRGAAVALAEIDPGERIVRYVGIGNIAGRVIAANGAVRHMVSQPGTAGHNVTRILEFQYAWDPGCVMTMSSDGLSSHWSLERYPGLVQRHPSLIAGVLYRDFHRDRDDASVVVVQQVRGPS